MRPDPQEKLTHFLFRKAGIRLPLFHAGGYRVESRRFRDGAGATCTIFLVSTSLPGAIQSSEVLAAKIGRHPLLWVTFEFGVCRMIFSHRRLGPEHIEFLIRHGGGV